jgi:hypothetical protein
MCMATDPESMAEALAMLKSGLGYLAALDKAGIPCEVLGELLRVLERADAVEAAVRGEAMAAFDAQDGSVADGQRTMRAWMVNTARVTKGQAAEYRAIQALAESHGPLLAGLAEGDVLTKSVAIQLAKWTAAIPGEYRDEAEEILVAAARAGADLRALAAICAEIRARTARPDPDDPGDPHLHRGVSLDTTMDGAGVLRGDLTPECSAMVQAVLDALSAPEGRDDLSVSTGDGGAWLDGDAARRVACEAMIIPVVTGDIDPGAIEAGPAGRLRARRSRLVPAAQPAR